MTSDPLKNLSLTAALPEELAAAFIAAGQPKFRGGQVFSWIHSHGVADPEAMTNLPKDLRGLLEEAGLKWRAETGQVLTSKDGTRKIEICLEDGAAVETVLIPDRDKLTQCVSSQVGCAVKCAFCRSGCLGLSRNLSAAEIIAQVHLARAHHYEGEKLRNVVFMGIGEPLHNTERVVRAVDLLCHPEGLDLSSRRVTVSTVGVVRGIERLAREKRGDVALAISLHAADDSTRKRLVPGAQDSLTDVMKVLKAYPLPPRRRFTIEYVLVDGVNDSKKHALDLVRLLSNIRCKVNLLPLNPHDKTPLMPPSEEKVAAFQKVLVDKGMSVFLRKRRGDDINAACGQLLSPISSNPPT